MASPSSERQEEASHPPMEDTSSSPLQEEALHVDDAALCFAHEDDDTTQQVEERFTSTADWGYLRLRGSEYGDDEMKAWAERVSAQDWGRAFVFFKHEDEGLGPKLERAFLAAADA